MWTILLGPLLALNTSSITPAPNLPAKIAAWTKIKAEAVRISDFRTVSTYLDDLTHNGNLTSIDRAEIETFMSKHGFSRSMITSHADVGSARIRWGRYQLTLM